MYGSTIEVFAELDAEDRLITSDTGQYHPDTHTLQETSL